MKQVCEPPADVLKRAKDGRVSVYILMLSHALTTDVTCRTSSGWDRVASMPRASKRPVP